MKIKEDIHIHTYLSSCADDTAKPVHYIENALTLGLECIGIADHLWDDRIEGSIDWYKPQNLEHIMKIREDFARIDTKGVKVLFGAETEYDFMHRGVAITPESAASLDFLLVPNSHTHITMPKELYNDKAKHAEFMVRAFMDIIESDVSGYITSIAHPFSAVCCPYDNREVIDKISDTTFDECFTAAKQKNIAVEINARIFKNRPETIQEDRMMRVFESAKRCGCMFTFGSDSHKDVDHDCFHCAGDVAQFLGLCDSDILSVCKTV